MSNELHFSLTVNQEIELHLFAEAQAEVLYQLIDSNREHLRDWLPWVDYETVPQNSLVFIQKARQQYAENKGFQLGIWYRGELAGVIGYHGINWPSRRVEIGYWLGSTF